MIKNSEWDIIGNRAGSLPTMDEKDMNKNMEHLLKKRKEEKHSLGIYIHIPFCVKKCDYCDFLSFSGNIRLKKEYVHALAKEIQNLKDYKKEYEVSTVFIGGGTPSVIDENDILFIMDTLKDTFNIEENSLKEVTIECNPGTLTLEKLLAYKKAGISRLSIGLQSANDEELKLLGRIHNFKDFADNYKLARKVGFRNINIDLMSSLPGQTIDSFVDTLEKVAALEPEHISAYSLIIEEGTRFFEIYGKDNSKAEQDIDKVKLLPDEDTDREMYYKTKEILESYGYDRYEISNYAKPGFECAHNSSYWRRVPYLGIGLGSSSLIHNKRFHNTSDMEKYIKNSYNYNKIREEVEELNRNQQMEEFMFLGLRMSKGISTKEFLDHFQADIYDVYGQVLSKLKSESLLMIKENQICLTEKGIDISNYVLAQFLLD